MDPMPRKTRNPRKPRKPRAQRLYQRRWCRPCKVCGALIVFLDETRPPINGKPRSPWVMVELYGQRDGQPAFWDGAICFNPAVHVEHTSCPAMKKRVAWRIRQANDDI